MAKYLEMFGKRYGEIIVKTTVLRWLTLVGAVLTLIVTVLMWVRINQQNVSYEEVEAFSGYEVYKGSYATMYFANGKMYSNIAGIKTDGIAFYIYLGALMSTVVFLTLHVVFVKKSDERTRYD